MQFFKRNKAVLFIVGAFAAVAYLLYRSGQLSKLAVDLGITSGTSATGGVRTNPLQIVPISGINRDQFRIDPVSTRVIPLSSVLNPINDTNRDDFEILPGAAQTGTSGSSLSALDALRQRATLVKTRVI